MSHFSTFFVFIFNQLRQQQSRLLLYGGCHFSCSGGKEFNSQQLITHVQSRNKCPSSLCVDSRHHIGWIYIVPQIIEQLNLPPLAKSDLPIIVHAWKTGLNILHSFFSAYREKQQSKTKRYLRMTGNSSVINFSKKKIHS